QLSQGGIGMPNRDYYFNTDARTIGVRKAYNQYLIKTFIQLGNDSSSATQKAGAVFELEKKLASSSRKLADLGDPYKNYNKMSLASLDKLSHHLTWSQYLQKTGITKIDSVIVGQPEFYSNLSNEIKKTAIDVWK